MWGDFSEKLLCSPQQERREAPSQRGSDIMCPQYVRVLTELNSKSLHCGGTAKSPGKGWCEEGKLCEFRIPKIQVG